MSLCLCQIKMCMYRDMSEVLETKLFKILKGTGVELTRYHVGSLEVGTPSSTPSSTDPSSTAASSEQ